jgi:anti-sigma factor RsiW
MRPESPVPASCARVRARLAAWLDGGLPPLEAALDRGHLEACAECARERERHERLLAAIRTASAPPALEVELAAAAVLARLPARPPARLAARWRDRAALAAAAALLLVTLVATRAAGPAPRPLDPATFERVLGQLPSWSDVVRGLGQLSRRIT